MKTHERDAPMFVGVRVPKPLLERLRPIADDNHRSTTKEVEHIIQRYLDEQA